MIPQTKTHSLSLFRLAVGLASFGIQGATGIPVVDPSYESKAHAVAVYESAKHLQHSNTTPGFNISRVLVGPNIPLIGDLSGKAYEQASASKSDEKNYGPGEGALQKRGSYGKSQGDTLITVVNSTPYRWRRGYISEYQVADWKEWPNYIFPGESIKLSSRLRGMNIKDSAAEVAYHFEGTKKPMSFMIMRLKDMGSTVVEFLEDLETKGNPKRSKIDLDVHKHPGGSNFVIAGKEGDMYSANPPVRWMQALLPEIGKTPLRELIMPRSHHSGLYYAIDKFWQWSGNEGNTITQSKDLPFQLSAGGIRVLDLRPMFVDGEFRESHGSYFLGNWNGGFGSSLKNLIRDVNVWQKENPGELIIWDFHQTNLADGRRKYIPFQKRHFEEIFLLLKLINNRVEVPDNEDITKWPLERFIGNNTSASIIRIHWKWLEGVGKESFPGGKEGFVSHNNFPYSHRWSDTNKLDKLAEDQLEHIHDYRPTRSNKLHNSDWLITQKGIEALGWNSIKKINIPAYSTLYYELWNGVTDESYPNWIAMDNVHSSEQKALIVAMNHCLVARKCGPLGGKVTALR